MILRIKVAQPVFLYAVLRDWLADLTVSFTYQHYDVTLTIVGGNVEKATWVKPEDSCQWYRRATDLVLTIAETERSTHHIADLITVPLHEELLKLIEGVTLQVLRVIRSIGIVPELPESLPRNESLYEELQLWAPEVSEDGVTWAPVFPPAPPRTLLGLSNARKEGFAMNAELNTHHWYKIREVLEDNLEIPPEDEFLTNTIGHLRGRNYRLAVVEAVIGLEIVLSRYLDAHLAIFKGIPKKRIKDFLRHDFGLTARLSGILDLTLHESYLKEIKLDQVLRAVDLRNGIVHRKGRLPPEIPPETIRNAINSVLDLARTLAELHIGTLALPDQKKISEAVMRNWSGRISWPRIWIQPWHRVTVVVECFGDPLSRDEMKNIAEEFGAHLKARDPRFDLAANLHVNYYHGFPREYFGQYWVGCVRLKGEALFEPSPNSTAAEGSTSNSTASSTQ